MEYIVEKTQKSKKLGGSDKLSIAKKIVEDFETYDDGRGEQLEKSKKLADEIFFKNIVNSSKEKTKTWKSTLKTRKIFMYSQILKAFIWKNVYANTNSMFDVSGENLEADNNSNKQKTALVDILEKMEYAKTCDKIIDNSLIYGELISFVTWKKRTEEYRRPIDFFEGLKDPEKLPKIAKAIAKGDKFYVDERIDYDNPFIYDVDPANFVFDTTNKDFDSTAKIYRTWKTPEDIIRNKYFEVNDEVKEYLRGLVREGASVSDVANQESTELKEEHVNGSTVEVLEHWGDLALPDGTVLRNWYAVVVGGRYLVQFEKNPLVMNPFTYGAYVLDNDNRRGVSPLYSIYDIALSHETMIRKTMDLESLNENPPMLAGKGFFGDDADDIEVYPGKIVEYDNALYTSIPVQPLEFNATIFQNELSYMDDLMSETSGVFPNMAGASENDRTTATEISTKVEGQLTRLKMLLDVINQNLILEDVKKVAKLKANFTFGVETVFINNENEPKNIEINDAIRQAQYRYTYADRSATSERLNYADMLAQSLQQFLKSGLQLNLQEVFTWYMEQKGVENPERFLQKEVFIDPQVQQALLQNPTLAPVIQQMTQRVQEIKQGKVKQDKGSTSAPVQQEQEQTLPQKLNALPGRNLMG